MWVGPRPHGKKLACSRASAHSMGSRRRKTGKCGLRSCRAEGPSWFCSSRALSWHEGATESSTMIRGSLLSNCECPEFLVFPDRKTLPLLEKISGEHPVDATRLLNRLQKQRIRARVQGLSQFQHRYLS